MPTALQQPGSRVVIGIAGRIGAGKTSVGKHLSSAHGFYYIRYSQVLADWLAEDPESKTQLQSVGWQVMAGGMQQELNSRLIARIPSQASVVVDGLRHPIDFDSLNESFAPDFHLFYVESSLETRWRRLQHRFSTLENFSCTESHAVEQNIPALAETATVVIRNEGSLHELYAAVDATLRKIKLRKNL